MAFTLPPLPYSFDALEPTIDKETMQIHHDKHHQAYIDNLNKAIAGTENENKTLEELLANAGTISPAVRNNGGGHWNHSFFWEILSADGGKPEGKLAAAIDEAFGSFDEMKEKFNTAGSHTFWKRLGMARRPGWQTCYLFHTQPGQSFNGCCRM